MFNKKVIMLLIILFTSLLCLSMVSATDSNQTDIQTSNVETTISDNTENIVDNYEISDNIATYDNTSNKSVSNTSSNKLSDDSGKQNVTINFSNTTAYSGKQISILANVTTSNGTKVNISSAVLKIAGKTITTKAVVNGVVNFTFTTPSLSAGEYQVFIKTGDTALYNSANTTRTLRIYAQNVSISFSNVTSYAGRSISITAKVVSNISSSINLSTAVLNIAGTTVSKKSVTNGSVTFTFKTPTLANGTYNMTIKTGATTLYNSANATRKLTIYRQNVTIKFNPVTTYSGKQLTIHANVTTSNGTKVNISTSVLKIAGITLASKAITNGQVNYTITVPNLSAGVYQILIKTGDTTLYNSATTTHSLSINRQNVTLSFNNITTYSGNTVSLTVKTTSPTANKVNISSAVLKIGGITVVSTKIVNGSGTFKFTVPNLASGTYNLMVKTGTTTLFNTASKTNKITIYRQNVTISFSNMTAYANKTINVTAKVTTSSGAKVNIPTSVLKLAGSSIAHKTVTNGQVTYTIKVPNLSAGNYTLAIKTGATTLYNSASASKVLTVRVNNTKVSTVGIKVSSNVTSQKTGKLTATSTFTAKNGIYSTSSSDTNAVLVQSGGVLSLINSTVTKTGNTANTQSEASEFYGTNAAVLVTSKSVAYIANTTITTNATGANAIFATNLNSASSGATINISNVNISTYQDKSRGLDATYGGIINAEYVTINTRGGSCAALATDRGEGTVNATNCVLNTGVGQASGHGSPCIYSTGNITATNCTGTSYVSQIGCIEGKNSITLNNCNLTGYGIGNRQSSGNYVDLGGFFIYQSMSGDADVGTATLNATNSRLTVSSSSSYYSKVPMFHVTNTAAIINLKNCTLSFGSGVLLNVSGQDQWGTSGSNGGNLVFTATNQTLTGNTYIDSISTLNLTLKSSTYKGAINPSSSYGTTRVTISSNSTWTLTGNSHVTSLTNSGTINYGSYTLYVNGVAYTASNPYKG